MSSLREDPCKRPLEVVTRLQTHTIELFAARGLASML